ncbi:hypothetical protein QO231_18185 [Sedimentitalea todarodis]|uniref:Secreted protein n=1 Tax=Sedimentitalea todarodis TaxID=1631240 RepID=A0ABU3VHV4_9RHOB|nr:hypothetical protein [Sedimentitalea todarodis]
MIELIFIVCLAGTPGDCEKRSLLYTDVTPMTCMMRAQPELANWISTHPRWKIARWACQTVRQDEHDV